METIGNYIKKEDLKEIGICQNFSKILNTEVPKKNIIIYIAQTPQHSNYNGYTKNTTRAYIFNVSTKKAELLFSNTTNHRAKIAINNYDNYLNGLISEDVWNNYITNGYTTKRRCLLFHYNNDKIKKMKKMKKSHEDYKPTGNSTYDHKMRVFLRN